MLTEERHLIILQLLKEKEIVKIQEIAEATNSSESTIRRDLSQLELEKKLKRVHGGAASVSQKRNELSMMEKSARFLNEKKRIAKYAASLIQDGDCIYLDAGTTTLEIIPFIKANDVTVVTNGLTNVESLLSRGIQTYMTGGMLKPKTKAFIGRGAWLGLQQYNFDKCFIGVNGIHYESGLTTPDPEEAFIKKQAITQSQEVFIVADSSKFNQSTFAYIASLKSGTILTDEVDSELLTVYQDQTTIKVVNP
ncbi:DeoR family fructose operon transcriptional repressor [Bacillus ectoiniformans]|uniref:DeoR/GlpR family DNA-binding transcription regulator n=1 Tax=Bacillus ectoiniformans TaxID=1494429 RepID=UPI0019596C52|nr:DeoR/GlpR family DNA-binding transcription regulator [Bacillus ectoiniformans]MBM7648978.1 DeoR family fructose operon transcriptional repressor [Bacillus ectoiniformans]